MGEAPHYPSQKHRKGGPTGVPEKLYSDLLHIHVFFPGGLVLKASEDLGLPLGSVCLFINTDAGFFLARPLAHSSGIVP